MAKYRALFAFFALLFAAFSFTAGLNGQSRRPRGAEAASGSFDYYVLSLSWAPEFCAQPDAAAGNPQECAPGARVGFVVHGLWPEAATGKSPESCGGKTKPKPVPKSVVNLVLRDMLSPGLIQHEWATHGTCSGLNPFDYFSSIVQIRAAVQIPVQITSIEDETRETPGQIETQFAEANPTFPRTAFRTSCPRGELQEERICFDKNLKAQACGSSLSECNIEAVRIRPRS
ncbi:MAG TPA: ribonuclease T2 [Bryobacteraceae bacterium]|jgi:ribonuclease T2